MKGAVKRAFCGVLDLLLWPLSLIFLPLLKLIRRLGVEHFPLHRKIFLSVGVFPVRDHYYEPQLRYSKDFSAQKIRVLPLDFAITTQLQELRQLLYQDELKALHTGQLIDSNDFYLNNGIFGPGDAEMYYLMIRNAKPEKIIEIGSGFSTLLALQAIRKNKEEGWNTELVCIEPYAKPWLTKLAGITLICDWVEKMDLTFFSSLQKNDILFIDSSHIIRPENDVLFIYLQLLPVINSGVFIHVHDIFSPRHYRQEWLTQMYRFWNEQYLLEALLYHNSHFKILFSLNYLKNDYYTETSRVLIHLSTQDEPSSFWLQKMDKKL